MAKKTTLAKVEAYNEIQDAGSQGRQDQYGLLAELYYDLATDLYEFGWGKSFHFAPRRKGESFSDSLARHELYLAARLGLNPGMEVLDVGCGVGGPLITIACYSGARITGLNIHAEQIERAKRYTRNVRPPCCFIHGDFMNIPKPGQSFEAAYSIEATPHAPDKVAAYREICRVLRPGAYFGGYEWCLTDKFDSGNAEHLRIRNDAIAGTGVPDLASTTEVTDALQKAGFELIESRDLVLDCDPETPWYRALQGRDISLLSIPRTPVGRALVNTGLRVAERLQIVPQGSRAVSTLLNRAGDAFVESGLRGIFTPLFFFLARKPPSERTR